MSDQPPDALFDAVASELLLLPGVSIGRSLRDGNLMVDAKIFAFLKDSSLVVKLPAARVSELEAQANAIRFRTGSGPMREWAVIDSTATDATVLWRELMREAHDFVAALPASKNSSKNAPKTAPKRSISRG